MIAIIVITLLVALIEYFFYKRAKINTTTNKWIKRLWWGQLVFVLVSLFLLLPISMRSQSSDFVYLCQIVSSYALAIILAELTYIIFSWWKKAYIIGVFVLFSFIYGIEIGRFNFERTEYSVELGKENFKDYKIIHITDFHCVSMKSLFGNRHNKLAEMINSENADLILFSGDIVTYTSSELDEFIPFFQSLKAKDRKIAILGNHDYGDYFRWENIDARNTNLIRLKEKIKECGFTLLCNENYKIRRGEDSLCIVGIENWGRPPFPQYSDIAKAEKGIEANEPSILLSHDPDYWEYQLDKESKHNYPLTLSGHTHAMQFGIDLFGIKLSPSSLKFDCWFGEYKNNEKTLIVSKGVGGAGIPFRLGMSPEYGVINIKN